MTMNINIGGAWRTVTSPKVNVGGSWHQVQNIWVNVGGVWRQAFANFGLSITVGPQTFQTIGSSAKRVIYRRTLTPVITGRVEPVTFAWSVTSDYQMTFLSSTSVESPTISISYDPLEDPQQNDSGTVHLTITNGDGKTATAHAAYDLG